MCCGQKRSLFSNRVADGQPSPARRQPSPNTSPMSSQLQSATTRFASSAANAPIARPEPPAPSAPPHSPVNLRYLKTSPVRVRGLITGNLYEFRGPNAVQAIDPRDVPSLVYTGLFRHA